MRARLSARQLWLAGRLRLKPAVKPDNAAALRAERFRTYSPPSSNTAKAFS